MKRTIAVFAALFLAHGMASAGENVGARAEIAVPGGMEALAAAKDRIVEVRVEISGADALNAVHVDVQYDAGLEYVDWAGGDLYSDPLVLGPFNRTERQVVDITVATLNGARRVDEATVATLKFRVIDPNRAGLRIEQFHTSDSNWEVDTHIDLTRGIDAVPSNVRLLGNTPNPFNPLTKIRYELPQTTEVAVEVLDVAGRLVRNLVSGTQSAGAQEVTWNGKNDTGKEVASGIYFVRLRAAGDTQMSKMTLIR